MIQHSVSRLGYSYTGCCSAFRAFLKKYTATSVCLLVGLLGPSSPLSAQSSSGCNQACQYCITLAETELVGCLINAETGQQDPTCVERVHNAYNICSASAQSLPPAPPQPPPSPIRNPPQSCSGPVLLTEDVPNRATLRPEDATTQESGYCLTLIDPVPDLVNSAGTGIKTTVELLASQGRVVSGVATDSAARLVIRIPADQNGERLTVSVQASDNVVNTRGLQNPLGQVGPISGGSPGPSVQVTAQTTTKGIMAFAQYFPPSDFSRGGSDDNSGSRTVNLTVTSPDNSQYSANGTVTLARPPVVLVHGIWGSTGDWSQFPIVTDRQRFPVVITADYSIVSRAVTETHPAYNPPLYFVQSNNLGFAINTSIVQTSVDRALELFRSSTQLAASQVDVIAHSMGGLVTRTLEYLPDYVTNSSFSIGEIHKLITIGSPHLGSPLAIDMLTDTPSSQSNACLRGIMALFGKYAFTDVVVNGATIPGGINDLKGDGVGTPDSESSALQFVNENPNYSEPPTALVAGTMSPQNAGGLAGYWQRLLGSGLARYCSGTTGEPLIHALASGNWSTVFNEKDSDAVVPLTSQSAGGWAFTYPNAIHSSGVKDLGFAGPTELDVQSGIPAKVIDLLNTPTTDTRSYRYLSHQ